MKNATYHRIERVRAFGERYGGTRQYLFTEKGKMCGFFPLSDESSKPPPCALLGGFLSQQRRDNAVAYSNFSRGLPSQKKQGSLVPSQSSGESRSRVFLRVCIPRSVGSSVNLRSSLLAVLFRIFSSRVFALFMREVFELQGRRRVDLPKGKSGIVEPCVRSMFDQRGVGRLLPQHPIAWSYRLH